MKRCPECRRDYLDDTLVYCLDDGSRLLDGPREGSLGASSEQPTRNFEPPTQIFKKDAADDRAPEPPPKRTVLFVSLGALLLAAIAGLGFYLYRPAPESVGEIKSIAVLPLENLSGDPAQEYFADGMTESIINNLSRVSALKVISRTSVMRYKRSGKSIPEIARELGVEGVVEGSVQRTENRIRITTQLVSAATDSPIWSQQFERPISDILNLQSEIAQALTAEIRIKLTPEEERQLKRSKAVDPAATEAFLLGKHFFAKWTIESERQAVEQFQKAVSIEPGYADAWAGLADAWTLRAMVGELAANEVEKPTKEATYKALEIDPDNSAAHVSMCFISNNYDFDWVAGERWCKRGIDLDPNNAKAHFAYAYLLARLDRPDEMAKQMEQALKFDPVEPWWPAVYGHFLTHFRRFDQAEIYLNRAVEIDPNYWMGYRGLADLYTELGRYDEALRMHEKAGGKLDSVLAGYIYARMGDRKKAMDIMNAHRESTQDSHALLYTALGDHDKAFELINRQLDQGNGFMFGYACYIGLDPLKSDPRWRSLRARMNFTN